MAVTSRLRARLETVARDLRTVMADLRGEHPSPLVTRKPGQRSSVLPSATTAAARPLIVRALHRETADALTIVLADPTGAKVAFVPGQFLTLLVAIDGETLRRAYSICSSLDDDTVAVTVKRIAGGRVSNHLHERLQVGDVIPVLGPSGEFTVTPDPAARRHLMLLAGGSGITPIMAIARAVLANEPDSRVTLVFGNRASADIIFRDELDAMQSERFVVRHVLEQPDGKRLDRATVSELLVDADAYYVCGPAPAMAEIKEALKARGVPAARVHEERFATAERTGGPRAAQRLVVLREGRSVDVVVPPDGTILDAGLAAGVAMEYSCAMGGCGACAVQLTDGEVDLDEPNCLSPEERAAGKILACVARPRTACTVEIAS
jgi:ferredoxin-NADP reductase